MGCACPLGAGLAAPGPAATPPRAEPFAEGGGLTFDVHLRIDER